MYFNASKQIGTETWNLEMAVLKSSFPALGALTTGCWREIQEASSPRELAKQRPVKGASTVLKYCWIEFLGLPVGFGDLMTLRL